MTERVLIIAQSGRMWAKMARQAGKIPYVVDVFADEDMQFIAEENWQVPRLSLDALQGLLLAIKRDIKISVAVYGSGLEYYPETLQWLALHFYVLGNTYATFLQFANSREFFKQLDVFRIAYPEVGFTPPVDASVVWLIKSAQHAGGASVAVDRGQGLLKGDYYQRFYAGQLGSVLVAANGAAFTVLGYHQQWCVGEGCFLFSGLIQYFYYSIEIKQEIDNWLTQLVAHYHLQGLMSLDFIVDNTRCYFLEINLRPPASVLLYPQLSLWEAHCKGGLASPITAKNCAAMQLVYAQKNIEITEINWPEWCVDLPKARSRLRIGEPICSILAETASMEQTLACLSKRHAFINSMIN